MDIEIEFDNQEIEIGNFKDLEYLVLKLSDAWKGMQYRLEEVESGTFLFIQDVLSEDDYECGIIHRKRNKAIALSPAVHKMVMSAYNKYVADFGEID